MFAEVRQDEIRRDGSDLIEASLAEFSLDIVLGGESETAVSLQADVCGFPGSIRGQEFRHICGSSAGLAVVKQTRRLVPHQVRGKHIGVTARNGKLNALVLTDRPPKDDALVRILASSVDEPVA